MSKSDPGRAIPAWPEDEPGSNVRPVPTPLYFDQELGVWVLTSYSDAYAALNDPALWPSGTKKDKK